MRKKTLKCAALMALCGSVLGWAGCLTDTWWGRTLLDGAYERRLGVCAGQ